MEQEMNYTKEQLAAAFTLWWQETKDEPSKFMTEEECVEASSSDLGTGCAICLLAYLRGLANEG